MRLRSRPIKREKCPSGIGKQEANRRLAGLGLSRHDDEAVQARARGIVASFLSWTARQRCAASGKRTGDRMLHDGENEWIVVVQAAHLDSRGAFGADFGNVIPLVDFLHMESHRNPAFFSERGLDPALAATAHAIRFFEEHRVSAAWILEHAQDGDVLTLARLAIG